MGEENNSMSLTDHLQEFRSRIIWVGIFFFVTLVIGFVFASTLLNLFKSSPAAAGIEWHVFTPTEGIKIYMQFAFLSSLTFTVPFALYHIWRFVSPGLTERERKATAWFIPTAFLLFITGAAFAFLVLFPMMMQFLTKINEQIGANTVYGMSKYFSFMFNIVIPFGLLFQLPLIVVFLTRIGILKPKLLVRFRKFAYLILVIIAASITPPDLVSEIMVSLPLILLYEISIWLSRIFARKREKKKELQEKEFEDEESSDNE